MSNKMSELEALCSCNGRTLKRLKNGMYYTADKYEGTDGAQHATTEAAIAWERGYKCTITNCVKDSRRKSTAF